MPELPEVETVRRFLEKSVKTKTITAIEVLNDTSFFGDPHLVINTQITDFSRIGKQLTIYLSNRLALLFHLKMTGQLVYIPFLPPLSSRRGGGDLSRTVLGHPTKNATTVDLPNRSTRVIFHFSDDSTLFFNDQRKFGWIRLLDPKDIPNFQKNLGPDILSPAFTLEYFAQILSKSSRSIKVVLLDQTKFAGIGNIYANDALWEAQVNPTLPANQVPSSKIRPLYNAIVDLIQESIAHGGSTARDNKYILPDGSFGGHQFHFRVYQREGESCTRCGTPIVRIPLAGRSAWFCPKCQTP